MAATIPFKQGGFLLHKWHSSNPAVLDSLPLELKDPDAQIITFDADPCTKTLGVVWKTLSVSLFPLFLLRLTSQNGHCCQDFWYTWLVLSYSGYCCRGVGNGRLTGWPYAPRHKRCLEYLENGTTPVLRSLHSSLLLHWNEQDHVVETSWLQWSIWVCLHCRAKKDRDRGSTVKHWHRKQDSTPKRNWGVTSYVLRWHFHCHPSILTHALFIWSKFFR